MPPLPQNAGHGQSVGRSTFDKLKMGALMGGWLIMGFVFGAVNIIRYGPGPNGMMRTLGQYMATSGTTFGFFMAIGATIRTDSSRRMIEEYRRVGSRRPLILSIPSNDSKLSRLR